MRSKSRTSISLVFTLETSLERPTSLGIFYNKGLAIWIQTKPSLEASLAETLTTICSFGKSFLLPKYSSSLDPAVLRAAQSHVPGERGKPCASWEPHSSLAGCSEAAPLSTGILGAQDHLQAPASGAEARRLQRGARERGFPFCSVPQTQGLAGGVQAWLSLP